MSTFVALEQRKHDLRVQMVKVYQKLCEVKRAEAYFVKKSKGHA